MKLELADFQPKSMLHVPETKVPRSRHPVIDIHTHLSIRAKSVNGVGIGEKDGIPGDTGIALAGNGSKKISASW